MKAVLEYLGREPKKSLNRFLTGLGLFALGLAFIALGYFHHHLWQIPGLTFLSFGCLLAAWGYLGIFSNRLLSIFNRY